jgi:hypothetical protein
MCARARCVCPPPPPSASLDFAYSSSACARAGLCAARLVLGAALLAFSVWSWASLSSSAAFGDGNGGGFGRTATQVTNWGLAITWAYFLVTASAALCIRQAAPAAPAPRLCARDAALAAPVALLATAFALEAAITILAWAIEDVDSLSGAGLASFTVKHTVWALLFVDVAVGRVPVPWTAGLWPLGIFALYLLAAGMYSIAQKKTPYEELSGFPGRVIAAIFVALATVIAGFLLLRVRVVGAWGASFGRGRGAHCLRHPYPPHPPLPSTPGPRRPARALSRAGRRRAAAAPAHCARAADGASASAAAPRRRGLDGQTPPMASPPPPYAMGRAAGSAIIMFPRPGT